MLRTPRHAMTHHPQAQFSSQARHHEPDLLRPHLSLVVPPPEGLCLRHRLQPDRRRLHRPQKRAPLKWQSQTAT